MASKLIDWHSLETKKVFENLDTSISGLNQKDVKRRIQKNGYNEIQKKNKTSPVIIFLDQFKSFFVIILALAAIISYLVGYKHGDTVDTWVIIAILFLNAIFGFIQEFKAEKSIEALRSMTALKTKVIRNGKLKEILTRNAVPGDILLLEAGDKIPADSRIITASNLETDESALTGESTTVAKSSDILAAKTNLAERKNILYSGTTITKGTAKAVIVETGMKTELGKIANMMQNTKKEETPLQKQLKHFGEMLGIGILIVCGIVFAISYINYGTVIDSLMISLSLAVAALPEGLPAIVTICLALGIQRMIKRNALIRKLPSVETLGCADVICTDKTGTLTYNQMTVREIYTNNSTTHVSGHGYDPIGHFTDDKDQKVNPEKISKILTCATLCNNSVLKKEHNKWDIIGDPTEGALVVAAQKAHMIKSEIETNMPRIKEFPFDSERKMMSTVNKFKKGKLMFVKGAPDILIEQCSKITINNKVRKLTAKDKADIFSKNKEMAEKALRVLAFAYKDPKNGEKEENLIFIGLMGMIDPPRKEVIKSIEKCKAAGIKVVMITGDHKDTATAIAKELGIGKHAITGEELDKIQNLEETVEHIDVYARVKPEHKLRIVKALKAQGHIVAMTGDGVNDAPALKGSDIGVAMGITGTDVSKEASDMILTDDNFSSIVNAVEEGRGIYDNIKKFIRYLISSNSGEVMTIFIATLIGFYSLINGNPLPILLPIHLLWINLVTDGFLALALGVDPLDKEVMERKPRKKKESLIGLGALIEILITAAIMTIGTILIFKKSLPVSDQYAQTMALTTLVIFQLFNVFNCRSENRSVFTNFFTNKWLIAAVGGCVIMQLVVIYTPIAVFFKTVPLNMGDWLRIIAISSTVIIGVEIKKLLEKLFHYMTQ